MTGGVLVSQLGARMHYAVPRILHSAGRLEHCYSDICGTRSFPRLLNAVPPELRPAFVRRLLGRVPKGVPRDKFTTFPWFGLMHALKRGAADTIDQQTKVALWAGRRFSEIVARQGFRGAAAVFGYSGECLEQLQVARSAGLRTIVEQTIAPREVVDGFYDEECARFGDWYCSSRSDVNAARYAEREKAEWRHADVILCGSHFVREGVIERGGAAERCVVVPYGVDASFAMPSPRRHPGPLRVLTIGEIGLRKGSPYVLEAARRMKGRAIFRMVGFCPVRADVRARLQDAVELVGQVPRSDIVRHFAWADVFLLPSLCEGSATVVYEALAAKLPVICTHNTGSVVRDGRDGFIVPVRNVDAIVDAIEVLASDPERRRTMAADAGDRAADFTVEAYSARLLAAMDGGPAAARAENQRSAASSLLTAWSASASAARMLRSGAPVRTPER